VPPPRNLRVPQVAFAPVQADLVLRQPDAVVTSPVGAAENHHPPDRSQRHPSLVSLFEFDRVSLRFDGAEILRNFALLIRPGEKVVITGPSGAGKSTVLRLFLGFQRPDSGHVRFEGAPLSPGAAQHLRRRTAYVNQSPSFEPGTAGEALRTLFDFKASPPMPDAEVQSETLASLELRDRVLRQPVAELSGGERQRLALAFALLLNRRIFLLDEPTAALDAGWKGRVADLFLADRPDWTVLAVAHDEAWWDRPHVTRVRLSI